MEKSFLDIRAKECQCKYCDWRIGLVTGEGKSFGRGECKRFPPIQIKEDEKDWPIGVWPITKEDDSCGEFIKQ